MHFQRSPSQFRKIINAFDSWNKKLVKDPLEVHQRKLFCFGSLTKSRLLRPGKFLFHVSLLAIIGKLTKTAIIIDVSSKVAAFVDFHIPCFSLGLRPSLGPAKFSWYKNQLCCFQTVYE